MVVYTHLHETFGPGRVAVEGRHVVRLYESEQRVEEHLCGADGVLNRGLWWVEGRVNVRREQVGESEG